MDCQKKTLTEELNAVFPNEFCNRILGSYFFEGKPTGGRHLDFLHFNLIPPSAVLFYNPNLPSDLIWFQQDEAPPHHS